MTTSIIKGYKITKGANLSIGCSATIFSKTKTKLLLTKRTDNQLWCLPGGRIEAGESAQEACIREVKEETGFDIEIKKILGVYSTPDMLVKYPDGNKVQIIALNFEAEILSGEFRANNEVSEIKFFSKNEINQIPIFEIHLERISDSLKNLQEVVIK